MVCFGIIWQVSWAQQNRSSHLSSCLDTDMRVCEHARAHVNIGISRGPPFVCRLVLAYETVVTCTSPNQSIILSSFLPGRIRDHVLHTAYPFYAAFYGLSLGVIFFQELLSMIKNFHVRRCYIRSIGTWFQTVNHV